MDLGNLDDSASDESGVRIRLLRPVMTLLGLTRGAEVLHIRGEPEPTGLIREVRRV